MGSSASAGEPPPAKHHNAGRTFCRGFESDGSWMPDPVRIAVDDERVPDPTAPPTSDFGEAILTDDR